MKQTKTDKVKQHLINKGHITSWEAIVNYRVTRLSAVIFDLKKNGWNIESVRVDTVDKNGEWTHFTEYFYRGE